MIRKFYNFVFAPPFDGFGPFVVNFTLLMIIIGIAKRFSPEVCFYVGMMTYPFLIYMRKKCENLSNWPERNNK